MKWIKSRKTFLNEAKIRNLILPRQAKEVIDVWGEKYLELDEIDPTDKIKQGTWKLSEEDKRKVLGVFFDVDMDKLYEIFKNLPDEFCEILKLSIKPELVTGENEKFQSVLSRFEIKEPSVDEIYLLFENVFRKLSVGETKATEVIQRDERGRPVMGEDGRPIKTMKEAGEPVFTNNLVNINSFITDFNNCYPENKVDSRIFTTGEVYNIRNKAGEDFSEGQYEIDFEIFKKDLFLQIAYKPSDILNMSISKFYASCQHLYSGGWREKVLSNIFDPNSIPAFLKFDTPIFWEGEKIADQIPLSRMQIRNIEGFNTTIESPKIFFDRCYPGRLQNIMEEMITKYSGNVKSFKASEGNYLFTPDVPEDISLEDRPYMDRLGIKTGKYIGRNAKTLYLSRSINWRNTVISPKAKVKEVIVETTEIPANMIDLPFDLDWIKFKFLKIYHLDIFKFKTEAYAFDKCRFTENVIGDMKKANPNMKKLSLISCDIPDLDLRIFDGLDELELIYTLDPEEKLSEVMGNIKVGKLRISGDVLNSKENKQFIQDLRKSGTKVEKVGLVI